MSGNIDLVILKSLVTNKKNALDFANECDSKLFAPEVWNFANLIISYIKTFKDIPTLRVITEKLSKGNNDKLIDSVTKTWKSLDDIVIDDKEFKHDLEKLKKRFAEKQISLIKDSLVKLDPANIDISKTVTDLQKTVQNINAINNHKSYESKSVKSYLPVFVERFNAKKSNPEFDAGLKTKYSFFDFATNGVKPADFVLIAGESGFGKSLFLNNIAVQVWMQDNTTSATEFSVGKNIIYFSLEMPYEDCFNRFLSRLSGVPTRSIESPSTMTRDDFVKIKKALDFIDRYPYQFKIVDIADACADDLEVILSEAGEDFDAIFVDYLGIMRPNKNSEEQDWLKQGIISYELRAIGRRRNKPIFSAVQLNRKTQSAKNPEDNIGLSRLARSGTIATHATHVIQIESRSNEELHSNFLYHLIKNRKGPKGKGSLIKNLACATLLDTPQETDINNQFTDIDDISDQVEDLEI